jgi:hypothetical protein
LLAAYLSRPVPSPVQSINEKRIRRDRPALFVADRKHPPDQKPNNSRRFNHLTGKQMITVGSKSSRHTIADKQRLGYFVGPERFFS